MSVRTQQGTLVTVRFRAQVLGVNGWVDGGQFGRRKDADADAARMTALYDREVRVVALHTTEKDVK